MVLIENHMPKHFLVCECLWLSKVIFQGLVQARCTYSLIRCYQLKIMWIHGILINILSRKLRTFLIRENTIEIMTTSECRSSFLNMNSVFSTIRFDGHFRRLKIRRSISKREEKGRFITSVLHDKDLDARHHTSMYKRTWIHGCYLLNSSWRKCILQIFLRPLRRRIPTCLQHYRISCENQVTTIRHAQRHTANTTVLSAPAIHLFL